MKPMMAGKLAAGIAGMTGAGSMSVFAGASARFTAAHAVPVAIWAVTAGLITVTGAVAALALILAFRQRKLEIESAAELEKARQEMYRTVLEKSAAEPGAAASYRELIIADALHLAVEQNGVHPADQTHRHLYGRGAAAGGSALCRPAFRPHAAHCQGIGGRGDVTDEPARGH
jgi:hypothetical protein